MAAFDLRVPNLANGLLLDFFIEVAVLQQELDKDTRMERD
jgi:hypothetical protein